MEKAWHTRLQISRHKDDSTWNNGLNWSSHDSASDRKLWNMEEIQSLHSCVSLWIFEWHWHIIVVSEQKSPPPPFSPSKTSTGPSGAQGRWLQIDNHQYSLSWFLDLLLSSFPNYLIMYRKLFINVFHLQHFAQVINYFKCLSISNDWFPLWYTVPPTADSLSHTGTLLYISTVLKHFPLYWCSKWIW